jgi:hypothetical protein
VTSIADRHRQAVYDVEDVAFGGTVHDEPMPFADADELTRAFCTAAWWAALQLPVPEVVATRVDSTRSYARCEGDPRIHLSPAGCTVATIAHELAHVLVECLATGAAGGDEPHHGPAFRRADVAVAAALMGSSAADRLAGAFADAGLDLGPEPVGAGAAPGSPAGFWAAWRSDRALAAAEPADRGPFAL